MSFLSDLFLGLLVLYIAFTNSLAAGIITLVDPSVETPPVAQETPPEESFLTQLPSRLSSIPDILLRSAAYQQAAVGGSVGLTAPTVTDPLDSIVNIFCTFQTPESIRTTTGTGFFIDPDGVIMTNAHVAQFLLLAAAEPAGEAQCIVRTGNPAAPRYAASLLYIPPAWVQDNAAVMKDAVPMGTGERDYALLYVNQTLTSESLPTVFPALPHSNELLSNRLRNQTVVAAGYPAGDLLQNGSDTDLIPRKADTTVSELYTFGSNRADVFAIRGSIVGAEGASGGPVLDDQGAVIGMIVTRGDDVADGPGSLRAISISHVHRTMVEETGFTLAEHLDRNIALRSQVFEETLTPFLLAILQAN
jgi:S1-C subfamily serine protease